MEAELIDKIKHILKGINESEIDSKHGWWETDCGAEFGQKKLDEIIKAINGDA
jgi:hypothetical protein